MAGTRKTTLGLRGVEKRAIAAGSGDTHRLDLSHMVMVKDNHVAELGMAAAVKRFRERASFATKIEVEVEDPADAPRAVEAGADVVLLETRRPQRPNARSNSSTATHSRRPPAASPSMRSQNTPRLASMSSRWVV